MANSSQKAQNEIHTELKYYNFETIWKKTKKIGDIRHGKCSIYYPNGNIQVIANYVYGQLDGNYLLMHENGKVWVKSAYVNGVEHGICRTYYESGAIKSVSMYKYGSLDGPYTEYYQDGEVKVKTIYREGLPAHKNCKYYSNGMLKSLEKFGSPGKMSYFLCYHKNGELKELHLYDEEIGEMINRLEFDMDGNCIIFSPKNSRVKWKISKNLKDIKKYSTRSK